jgi:hypothetical protein
LVCQIQLRHGVITGETVVVIERSATRLHYAGDGMLLTEMDGIIRPNDGVQHHCAGSAAPEVRNATALHCADVA